MATDAQIGEMDAFYRYLSSHQQNDWKQLTPEDSVRKFREQQQFKKFIADTQIALEQSRRGESKPLDIEQLIQEVDQELAEEGIPE